MSKMASVSEMEELVKQLYEEEAERNSRLFGIKKEHLIEDAEIKVSYFNATAFSYRFTGNGNKAQIRVPFTAGLRKLDSVTKKYLRHEVRHGIARNIRAHVIRQNPEQFMDYFHDNFEEHTDMESIDQLINFPLMPKWKKELLSKYREIDLASPDDVRKNADTISMVYLFAGMNQNPAFASLEETFADDGYGKFNEFKDSKWPKILAGTAVLSAAATAAAIGMELYGFAAAGAVSTLLNGAACLYSKLMKTHYASLPEGADISSETLEKFPIAQRKYLVAFPPVDRDPRKMLKRIRRYGINIKQ